jgi:hypothetical protein
MRYEVRDHLYRLELLVALYDGMDDRAASSRKRIVTYNYFDHSDMYRIVRRLKIQEKAILRILEAIVKEDERFLELIKQQ